MTDIAVAILDDFQNVARSLADWKRLPQHVSVTVFNDYVEGEALVQRLAPFQIVVAMRERTLFPRDLVQRLPHLKLLVTTGARNLGIDLTACQERGILVCGTDSGGAGTAELAWGLILALARHIPEENRAIRAGQWQTTLGFMLKDKTLGILGLGKLGVQMTRIAQAFGMYVIAWSQNLTRERAERIGATRVEKDELFAMADVLSVHLLLSERTRGIVGAREFAAMKPSAIFINTARTALVDETALVDALVTRKIAGAGIDVYSREPLPPDAPILSAPNTVLTPHLGYVSRESYEVYFPQVLEDIEAWLSGRPIRVLTV